METRNRKRHAEHIRLENQEKRKSFGHSLMECSVNLGERVNVGINSTNILPNPNDNPSLCIVADSTPNPIDNGASNVVANALENPKDNPSLCIVADSTPNPIDNGASNVVAIALANPNDNPSLSIVADSTPNPSDNGASNVVANSFNQETSGIAEQPQMILSPEVLRGKLLDYLWVASNRNTFKVMYSVAEKQRYKKSKRSKKNGYMAMVCCVANCKARVYHYDDNRCVFPENFLGHNHTTTFEETVEEHAFKQTLKDECSKLDTIGGKLPSVQEIYTKKADESKVSVSFKAVQNVCNKARRNALPKNAKTVQEVLNSFEKQYVREMYGTTHRADEKDKSPFFKTAFECAEYSFCVFASDDIVKAIEENVDTRSRKLYADATFKVVPFGVFKQLLIIFCELLGNVVPFAFVLMSAKSEIAYSAVFRYLNEHVMSLQCRSFMSDYERALRNAFMSVSPDAQMTACWFHFTQNCKGKAYKFGMKHTLETNKHARDAYYDLLALPLLPAKDIRPMFQMIEARVKEEKVPRFKAFLKYYQNQWLTREGPDKISVFDMFNRSTGAVESYNGIMGKNIPAHAHFFRFVLGLRHQEWIKAKMVQSLVESGGATAADRKGKSKVRQRAISDANEALKRGEITPQQFLRRVTHKELKICNDFMELEQVSPIEDDNDDNFDENGDDDGDVAGNVAGPNAVPPNQPNPNLDGMCIACTAAPANCVIVPCGHCMLCMSCWDKWDKTDTQWFGLLDDDEHEPDDDFGGFAKCPLCKSNVLQVVQLYKG